jgi:hypothetical protein
MLRYCFTGLALAVLLLEGSQVLTGNERKKEVAFGALESASAQKVQAQAQAWLKEVGKTDAATTQQFDAIWKEDRPVLDRLADTFALGDASAARLLAEARDPLSLAPTKVPAAFSDAKLSAFYRNNLALAYARSLSNRRVHDEALKTLLLLKAEQVVDPGAYLFHRAVCEHALLMKAEASKSINRLLDDVADAPERYKTVSALMHLDMLTWKEKDLGAVARKMRVVEDRLDLARGGPETQTRQKEILARLDELIKELENKAKNQGQGGGADPNGGG